MRNIQNDRVKIYLENPTFYQERLIKLLKVRNFEIFVSYVEGKRTLAEVGREYHISKERVRQIVAKGLFKVIRIYTMNKGIIETVSKEENPLDKILESTKKFIESEIKRRYKDLVVENTLLKMKLKRMELTKYEQSIIKQRLSIIEDQGIKGYLLEDIKKNLGEGFTRFTRWYEGKTGGIYQGKYYVMKDDYEQFLAIQN